MQKITEFLERYMQWVALALGGLYLTWMLWAYVINPPLSVKLGAKTYGPGEGNRAIAEGPVRSLEDQIRKSATTKPIIKIPPLVEMWDARLALTGTPTPVLAAITPDPPYDPGKFAGLDHGPVKPENNKVTRLVKAPVPLSEAIGLVRTVILVPDPKAGKVIPAALVNNAIAKPNVIPDDRDIVSTLFKVEGDKLAQEFKTVYSGKNPPLADQVYQTMFLQVELVREEKLPDGSWGNSTTVAPLFNHAMDKYPGDTAKLNDGIPYENWASAHSDDIIDPVVYDTAPGADRWHRPDETPADKPAGQPVMLAPFDPANPPPPSQMTPEQKRQVADYQKQQQDFLRQQRRAQTPPRAPRQPGPAGRTGLPAPAPVDPGRPPEFPPPPPGAGYPPPGAGFPPRSPGYPVPPPAGSDQPFNPNPNAGAPAVQGMFNATTLGHDIEILAHDDTVVPGKTYRYKLRYKILNSIYGSQGIAQPQNLADHFAVVSEFSESSKEITIPLRLRYFVASIYKNDAKFDVFTWKGGKWHRNAATSGTPASAAPGDAVAGTDSTVTVVDIRRDNRGTDQLYAILLGTNGSLEYHDVRTDQAAPDREDLINQAKASEQASLDGTAR